ETLPIRVDGVSFNLDLAAHEHDSDRMVLICPGACEPLAGRIVEYAVLAEAIVAADLGAVIRYNDPYQEQCAYSDFLIAKLRKVIEYTLDTARHYCASATPRLQIMAYSSSAGAAAKLAAQYDNVETLLLIAPSYDVPQDRILRDLREFRGHVRVLVGDRDQVVLPQQAFWYYENALSAASREYVEAPCCGHAFEGPYNKALFSSAPSWAFGKDRPIDFPAPSVEPSEAWV
ncbi:MAG: hypothetical protein AAF961_00005, partial [Planctomycetota bacterium]